MTSPVAHASTNRRVPAAALVAVALISCALLSYEIVLMRRLLIERWHHFGYLVISIALLGYGASGTLLALLEQRVRARPERYLFWLTAALALSLLIMPRLATLLPVTVRFIPTDFWSQLGWWSLFWLTALVPFLLGALVLGAALMLAGPQVGRAYAANLFGSAVGAAAGALLMSRFLLEDALWPSFLLSVAAVLILPQPRRRRIGWTPLFNPCWCWGTAGRVGTRGAALAVACTRV